MNDLTGPLCGPNWHYDFDPANDVAFQHCVGHINVSRNGARGLCKQGEDAPGGINRKVTLMASQSGGQRRVPSLRTLITNDKPSAFCLIGRLPRDPQTHIHLTHTKQRKQM
jgi:hypothetical protein